MRHALTLLLPAIATLALSACGPKTPSTAPINNADQMCCMKGDVSSGKFGGCVEGRKNRQCDEEHPLWIRGVISCGPVDEANCLGSRCCEFGQAWGNENSTLDWDPPGEDKTEGTPVEQTTPDAAEAPAENAPASEDAQDVPAAEDAQEAPAE